MVQLIISFIEKTLRRKKNNIWQKKQLTFIEDTEESYIKLKQIEWDF